MCTVSGWSAGSASGTWREGQGLSKQTLSKLEMGNGNPTVETLAAVGSALDVSLRRLVTEWGTPVYVLRSDQGEWSQSRGHQERALDEVYGSGYVRTVLLKMTRGDDSGEVDAHQPGTLHHAYVVTGKVRIGPTSDLVDLSAGDFVRFPGDIPHRQTCLSDRALLHMVTTLPQVRQFGPTVLSRTQST